MDVWAIYAATFVLAAAFRYMLGQSQACLYVGKAISDSQSKTGLQDAVTPPMATRITILLWLTILTVFGYSFWAFGIGTGFVVLAEFALVTVVAGATVIPKPDSPYFVTAIYRSMVGRVADYAKHGDKMRSDAMRSLTTLVEERLFDKLR